MFTVTVGFEGSGKSRNLSPFARRYSVMPSTAVTRVTPAGRVTAAGALAGAAAGAFGGALAGAAVGWAGASTPAANTAARNRAGTIRMGILEEGARGLSQKPATLMEEW